MAPFLHPGLVRLPALQADLEFLAGPRWRDTLVALPATEAYRARLIEVAFTTPVGLLSHHYLRYLGDLSGGQILRTLIGRTYGLEQDGLRFYVFDDIARPKVFKDDYRAALDALPWGEAEQETMISEVSHGFRLNAELFEGLGSRYPATG
jgi:heme oxygenase